MQRVAIPGTELTVSALCLGTGSLGTRVSQEDSFRMLDRFAAAGGTFLDSAHVYAAWVPGGWGVPERTLGAWLRQSGARDQVVLGTKGGHPHLHSMEVSRLSPEEIRQDLEESRERLGVETIDVYWLHRDDVARPVGEMVETLAEAVRQGKIRAWGLSNWSAQRLREAAAYASRRGLPPLAGNQIGWSLAERRADAGGDPTVRFMEDETYALHQETGLFAAAFSSQANGFFGGAYGREIPEPQAPSAAGVVRSYYSETNFRRLERARELAARRGCSANDVALAFLTSQPFPVCAIVGPVSEAQLESSLGAADLQLDPEELQWLVT